MATSRDALLEATRAWLQAQPRVSVLRSACGARGAGACWGAASAQQSHQRAVPARAWGCPAQACHRCDLLAWSLLTRDGSHDGAHARTIACQVVTNRRMGLAHRSGSGLVHARAVSFAWGFADDVVVRMRCGASGSMAVLEAQVIFTELPACGCTRSMHEHSALPGCAARASGRLVNRVALVRVCGQRAYPSYRSMSTTAFPESLACCAQSALRLGRSDFGVNRARLAALWAHVLVQAQRLPQAPC